MNSNGVILLSKESKKSQILIRYLEKLGLAVYPVRNLEDVALLCNERGLRNIFIVQWGFDDPGEIKNQLQENLNHLENYYFLVSEGESENQFHLIEQQMLTPWHGILYLPERMFQLAISNKVTGNNWQLSEDISIQLKQKLQNLSLSFSYDTDKSIVAISDNISFSGIIYESQDMDKVIERSLRVAKTDANILITGESGTGKELIANLIHSVSRRKNEAYLRINCAAIAPSLVESELFGHEKGSFTGAVGQRKGYFEASHQGTLFLDEIGEIDLSVQAKLLRVLEYGELLRVGSITPIKVDVRIVAATNRDLKEEVAKGNFREDLYYRLNVVQIHIPPLRERKEDIPKLFNFFMANFNQKYNKRIAHIDTDAKRALINYPWPGNVRELKNTIEGVTALVNNSRIELSDLPGVIQELGIPKIDWKPEINVQPGIALDIYEKEIIKRNLEFTQGNRRRCADVLNISERTLYRKIKEYGLDNDA